MRLALTGPEGAEGNLGEELRELATRPAMADVEPLHHPLLETVFLPAEDLPPCAPGQRDFLVLSSPRAAEAFAAVRDTLGVEHEGLWCVGTGTFRRAVELGLLRTRLLDQSVGAGGGAENLLDWLRGGVTNGGVRVDGATVFLPQSARARPDLADGLRAMGARVETVTLYDMRTPDDLRERVGALLDEEDLDAVLMASPSAVEALVEGAGDRRGELPPLLAIGPTTAEAMRSMGLTVAATAERPEAVAIARALEDVMASNRSGGLESHRPRRLRRTAALRDMVRETSLAAHHLVAPMFVAEVVGGDGAREPVPSMPGVNRTTVDACVEDARALHALGVRAVLLFGIPRDEDKDGTGSAARAEDGIVPRAIKALKAALPDLQVWADVCLCEYTDHGHCGPLDGCGVVMNDETVVSLASTAAVYARAGADAVCPSDMMDGRVGHIRRMLDRAGFQDTLLVSYAVKYASAYYGPFRDAAGSAPKSGDRRGYQMDPANGREALREAALDEAEGADILMVKPALAYLDIVRRVRERTTLPVVAYNVSGEYAMLKAAAAAGWIDGERVMMETLLSMRRAGADLVITYHAAEAAALLARR